MIAEPPLPDFALINRLHRHAEWDTPPRGGKTEQAADEPRGERGAARDPRFVSELRDARTSCSLTIGRAGAEARRRKDDGTVGRRSAYPPRLAAMAEVVVGQHDRHHRLADRHRANADARIVAALGRDLGVEAGCVDRLPRRQDR